MSDRPDRVTLIPERGGQRVFALTAEEAAILRGRAVRCEVNTIYYSQSAWSLDLDSRLWTWKDTEGVNGFELDEKDEIVLICC